MYMLQMPGRSIILDKTYGITSLQRRQNQPWTRMMCILPELLLYKMLDRIDHSKAITSISSYTVRYFGRERNS